MNQIRKEQLKFRELIEGNEADILVCTKEEYLRAYYIIKQNCWRYERRFDEYLRGLSSEVMAEDLKRLPLILCANHSNGNIVERKPFAERDLEKPLLIVNYICMFKEWSDNENLNKEFWEEGFEQKRLDEESDDDISWDYTYKSKVKKRNRKV